MMTDRLGSAPIARPCPPLAPGVALVLALLCGGCSTAEEAEPLQRPATRVEAVPAATGTIVDRLTLHAEVQATTTTRVAAGSLGGKIEALLVDEGDHVRAGDVLAKISSGLADAQLAQAKVALDAARANHGRVAELAKRGLASPAHLEQAQTGLAQAEAGLQLAQARHDDAIVRAPHRGAIAKRYVTSGEQANPLMLLFDLVDISEVKVVAQLPEKDVATVKVGTEAAVTAAAYGDESVRGQVRRVGMAAAPFSRTFDLEVRVANPDGKLRPGMFARVTLDRRVYEDVVVVRRDAVVQDHRGPAVFLVDAGGRARRQAVTAGPVEGDRVAILAGLSAGQPVVVVGQRMLVDGEPVKVVSELGGQPAPMADKSHPASGVSARP